MKQEIQVRRKELSSHLPPLVIADSRRKLGSVFHNNAPLRGLSFEEEKKYLPTVLGVSADSPDFTSACKNFWMDMSVEVPSEGVVLDITKTEEGDPINIVDWIKYKWLILHPFVATSKDKMTGRKSFYIYSPEEEIRKKNNDVQLRKAAYKELIKINGDKETTVRILRILGTDNPNNMTTQMMENYLADIVDNDPKRFYEVATDSNLEHKDFVLNLYSKGILQRIGSAFLYMDTEIGATMKEAVYYVQNKRNTQVVAEMKAKLKEVTVE